MPSKSKKATAAQSLPTIPKELIDQFVSGPMSAEAVNAVSMAFKKEKWFDEFEQRDKWKLW